MSVLYCLISLTLSHAWYIVGLGDTSWDTRDLSYRGFPPSPWDHVLLRGGVIHWYTKACPLSGLSGVSSCHHPSYIVGVPSLLRFVTLSRSNTCKKSKRSYPKDLRVL